MNEENRVKAILEPEEIPRKWYNIQADLPEPVAPPINPATKEPLPPEALHGLFAKELIRQEVCQDRYVDIPEELIEAYLRMGRPSPLYRAKNLERKLKTPARIYYKREDLSPTGSHKINTAIAQAYYNAEQGLERLTTETGAGQWGSALSLACSQFDLGCEVFMVRCSFEGKPYRREIMRMYGAEVHPSPSDRTESGRKFLSQSPDHPGSLGIAISEAVELAMQDDEANYSLGSVLNHVLLHQSIIGIEVLEQLKKLEETPDVMIGCFGGGSNFGGFVLPSAGKRLRGESDTQLVAAESEAAPSMTKGEFRYDFGDSAQLTPMIKMHTLGHDFIPPAIHAGGLRYHGAAPIISHLKQLGHIDTLAYPQEITFEAAELFAKTEGIIPAPETSHAIRAAVDKALEAKERGEEKVIVFNFSGHGLIDMGGYQKYLDGTLGAC